MLTKLATEAGMSEKDFLRITLERTKSVKDAAKALQMSETGVKWHMAKHGFRIKREIVTKVIEG